MHLIVRTYMPMYVYAPHGPHIYAYVCVYTSWSAHMCICMCMHLMVPLRTLTLTLALTPTLTRRKPVPHHTSQVIALLYANFFLAPMLFLCGPSSSGK